MAGEKYECGCSEIEREFGSCARPAAARGLFTILNIADGWDSQLSRFITAVAGAMRLIERQSGGDDPEPTGYSWLAGREIMLGSLWQAGLGVLQERNPRCREVQGAIDPHQPWEAFFDLGAPIGFMYAGSGVMSNAGSAFMILWGNRHHESLQIVAQALVGV